MTWNCRTVDGLTPVPRCHDPDFCCVMCASPLVVPCQYILTNVFPCSDVFWKLYKKTKFVTLETMDFETGRRELDNMADDVSAAILKTYCRGTEWVKQEEAAYVAPTSFFGRVWDWSTSSKPKRSPRGSDPMCPELQSCKRHLLRFRLS